MDAELPLLLTFRSRPFRASRAHLTALEASAVLNVAVQALDDRLCAHGIFPLDAETEEPIYDAADVAKVVDSTVRRSALALWLLEQLLQERLELPSDLDPSTSLTWAMHRLLTSDVGRT